jgi:hypothetical protein
VVLKWVREFLKVKPRWVTSDFEMGLWGAVGEVFEGVNMVG